MTTIKDVAKLAGVSTATVSRALNEPQKVGARTRSRVLEAIEQTGYVANVMASGFRRKRSGNILLLVPDIANPFYSKIIKEIELGASKNGYRILLAETRQDEQEEQAYANLAVQRVADGIISLGAHIPFSNSDNRKTLDPKWPPLVMVCEYHGVIPVPAVVIDNCQAIMDIVNHLLGLGHRRIAYVGGPAELSLCRDRERGFLTALQDANLQPVMPPVACDGFEVTHGRQAGTALLSAMNRPTAVVCASDELAIGMMDAARTLGLAVPDDVSVVGFDDIVYAGFTNPPLTTVRQPMADLGRCAIEMMLDILQGKSPDPLRSVLPHQVVIRESVKALNSQGV